ncbi:hypothetical protein AX774_g4216 [Zancudomyces culisetae]|uniref:Uncharacterized protein n=1 Tax=Zancudomyces culisetae TaxID=1213189 RepID=A0A1R1PL65_ZANCU|nr:hypothetical protein AX774_g4825 [Zancudomyces culisetae]OMH82304.1 hypothetical protein AX774_g4216 [Zancudomyces culisetae]|eukprot:OMH81718.1 hypothetical protein AX774_g4825 [Zancudomyces culisetae]
MSFSTSVSRSSMSVFRLLRLISCTIFGKSSSKSFSKTFSIFLCISLSTLLKLAKLLSTFTETIGLFLKTSVTPPRLDTDNTIIPLSLTSEIFRNMGTINGSPAATISILGNVGRSCSYSGTGFA